MAKLPRRSSLPEPVLPILYQQKIHHIPIRAPREALPFRAERRLRDLTNARPGLRYRRKCVCYVSERYQPRETHYEPFQCDCTEIAPVWFPQIRCGNELELADPQRVSVALVGRGRLRQRPNGLRILQPCRDYYGDLPAIAAAVDRMSPNLMFNQCMSERHCWVSPDPPGYQCEVPGPLKRHGGGY